MSHAGGEAPDRLRWGQLQRHRRCTAAARWLPLLLLWVVGGAWAGQNVWTSHGPEGGYVRALGLSPTDPQVVYAGMWGGGVFKSTDGGGNWTAVNTGLTNTVVWALGLSLTDPQVVYAGTDGGVFKSTDGGGNWTAVNTGLTNTVVWALGLSLTDPQVVYAGTDGGMFKTTNGGGRWTRVNTGLTYTNVRALGLSPTDPQVVYAGTGGGGVFKSTDGGGSWTAVNTGLTYPYVLALGLSPTDPQVVYAGTEGGGVFKSTDGGGSWTAVNAGLTYPYVRALGLSPTDPQVVYAGTSGGVFKSTNGGGSWTAVNTGLTNTNLLALGLSLTDPQVVYAGTSGGGVFAMTLNASPQAEAGLDQGVVAGATVPLDGSASSDADGDPLTYRWTAPAEIVLSDATAIQPTFSTTTAGTYSFSLVVNDGTVDSAPDTVVVTVSPAVIVVVRGPNADCSANPPLDCTTLTAGFVVGATDGLDSALGEVEQPPLPPATTIFDVRFAVAGLEGLRRDLRAPDAVSPTWPIRLQAGWGDHPVIFTWNRSSLPPGPWRLRNQGGTQQIDVAMTSQDSVAVTDTTVTRLEISRTTAAATRTLTYGGGWSMISLPVTPASGALTTLFPGAISAFRFAGGYQQVTTLSPGEGYWLNLPAGGGTYTLTGTPVDCISRALATGWSMVGAPLNGTTLAHIVQSPANSIISVFKFAGGYQQVTSLPQGGGYWVNLRNAGTLTLHASPTVVTKPVVSSSPWPTDAVLWAEGDDGRQSLELGVSPDVVVALPPLPPAGVLDLRVQVGDVGSLQVPRSDGPQEYAIALQGEGVTLGWDVPVEAAGRWALVIGDRVVSLSGHGSLALSADEVAGRLRLRDLGSIPSVFSLATNYPNPFNPTTTIRYELAQAGPVSLRVYAVTGQLVRTLAEGDQAAGSYLVEWDGRDAAGVAVGNGVYLCQLQAGDYRAVRRMVLMK